MHPAGGHFHPDVGRNFGMLGPRSSGIFRQFAKTAAANSGYDGDATMGQLFHAFCVAIQSVKAKAVLRRTGHPHDLVVSAVEAAAAALALTASVE